MRKSFIAIVVLAALLVVHACTDYETYGDKKKQERASISQFISDSAFVIITESQFQNQGNMTNGDKEFVLLNKSGVYMQIVRKGCGDPIKDGERVGLLCRFFEMNIQDTTGMTNMYAAYDLDKMTVERSGSTYAATFTQGLMYSSYGASVPEGWLVPLDYINVGRPSKPGDEIAKVRLIVPHSQGTTNNAKSNVYPYYYEITFERER